MKALKFTFLLLCLMGLSAAAQSQSADFISLEGTIKGMIQSNRWDDVLLTAPDLIIADPTRAEGYYYTALAFIRIGQPAQAQEYLNNAKALQQPNMADRLAALEKEMKQASSLQQQQDRILAMGGSGTTPQAAAEWKHLWELNKQNLTNGLEAVERYIELKEWEEALAILQDPAFAAEPKARQLIDQINQTPEMKRLNSFRDAQAQSRKALAEGRYADAIAAARRVLGFEASNAEAKKIIAEAEDELAWKKATDENSITSYEQYLDGNTRKAHAGTARARFQEGLLRWGEVHAQKDDVAGMEERLLKYLNRYPQGAEVERAKTILCTTYLRLARAEADQKTAANQQKARELLSKAEQYCPASEGIAGEIRQTTRREKRYGRPNRTYITYLYDTLSPIGLGIGSINNRSLGFYMAVRGNEDLFTETDYFTVNDQGQLEDNIYSDIRFTGTRRTGRLTGTLGLTKKITYPLWIYAGAGVYHSRELWEMKTYDDDGSFVRTSFAKNTDHAEIQPIYEGGLILDLAGFNVRAGATTLDFSEVQLYLGLGFSFRRY